MIVRKSIRTLFAACAVYCIATIAFAGDAPTPPAGAARDGRHDFDFNLGEWKTHIRRNMAPLTGRAEFIELDGTVRARPVWNGKAQIEEIDADGPQGHWQGMTLFLYNAHTGQWNQSFANSASGNLGSTLIGSYASGRIELLSQDNIDGRAIMVRGTWSDIRPDSHNYQEDYSSDGGRSWEPVFIARLTRQTPSASAATERNHDFDFALGSWKTHSSRLLHPLTGSHQWAQLDGVTVVSPIWGGRGNFAEYRADGPGDHAELLAVRLFDPTSGYWNINFATSERGTLAVPGYGKFENRRIDFYDQETLSGRPIQVRFSLWPVDRDTARSEQAFSADGGRTWEVNWITEYKRMQESAVSR
jgi:hypothetical protein